MGIKRYFTSKAAAAKEAVKQGKNRIYRLPSGKYYVGTKIEAMKAARTTTPEKRKTTTRRRRNKR